VLQLDDDPAPTPLQERLEVLANQIGVAGTGVASVLFVVLIIFWAVDLIKHSKSFVSGLPNVLQFFIISITLIVVAVPEGLPLAVTISLAYSMSKMLADNNLVRVLSACETMGNATMICSDKTGTLTQNQMTVTSVVIGGRFFRERLPTVEDIPSNLLVTLLQGEALNSKVFIAPPKPEDPPNAPIKYAGGNQTACALLRWAITLGCDFEAIRRRVKIEKAYPFSSTKKQGSVLVRQGGGSRLYVKGAVESILSRTRFLMSADGKSEPLDNDMRAKVSRTVDAMTRRGLRCIGMAFQDFGPIQYNELGEVIDHDESQEAFTLLAITGIKDPLRPGVPSAVKKCQQAGIIVRMVTGDHIETAKFIARDAGILTSPSQIAMTGPDFRAMTDSEKAEIIPRLRVLARSSPLDKEILVRWLKEQGNVVAVTGDGTNDAPALKAADVGLAMGIQGTDVAKKASSIIILDDDFSTIVKSVMWGRSVYDNIKKFVQFQITVNIIALMITLIGAFNPARSVPLTAVQLLWVNLIMDTMAALALGTEIPTMELLDRKPFAKTSSLISRLMWRNILGQSVLQLTVLLVILYSGDKIWGVPLDSVEHYTLLFNSFVWLQVFNEINSRKCNGEQNVFSGFFTNAIFVGVLVFTAVLQIILVQFCGSFAQTTPLSIAQWGECILIGAFSLPWGAVVRLVRLDDSDGQIELDPREFEVAPFPDEVDEQEMMRRKTIVGEVKNDDEDTKTPRGSTKTKKKKKHADD
jgi:calcium-translocating P-type ATPase